MRAAVPLLLGLWIWPTYQPAPARPPQDPVRAPANGGPAACGRCHPATLQEWQGSAHATAWINPVYQKSLQGKEHARYCHGCHAPGSVLDRLGHRPQVRPDDRDHGITCTSCHQRGTTIHGPFGATTSAHPTERDLTFTERGSTGLCASCHGTRIADVLPLAAEFAAAGLAERGKSCVGCHMPEVVRPLAVDPESGKPVGEPRHGRSHELLGPDDPGFCGDAFALRARRQGDQIVVILHNRAGHGVPGLQTRSFPILVRQRDSKGRTLHEHPFALSSDNRLLVDEERRLTVPAAPGTLDLQVQIDHRLAGKFLATVTNLVLEIE